VNEEIRKSSDESGGRVIVPGREGLNVEVRVREIGPDARIADGAVVHDIGGQSRVVRLVVLVAILMIAGLYVGPRISSAWVPADDGILAQSAVRVLQGQLPHRDFTEIYTGGLSVIHALAFRIFGVNLLSMRICVFLFFLAWIPALYSIALRFTSALGAGLIALVAVAWSYPNYPSAMPSWYNLFFATFGAAAMLRYLDVRQRRWLFVAGVCGGVSILIKIIGAYYVAGALLFLAFLEQNEAREDTEKTSWAYPMFSASALLVFLGTLVYVVHARLTLTEFYHFVLPSAAVVGMIVLGERNAGGTTAERFRALFGLVLPFVGGVLAPIVIFLTPYILSGALSSFFSGVAGSVMERASGLAVIRPAPLQCALYLLPLIGLLAAAMYWEKFQGAAVGVAIGMGAVVIVVRATQSMTILSRVWFSAVMLTPAVVVVGVVAVLVRGSGGKRTDIARQRVALLVSLAATCTLVQFPFAAPIYLCYSLPLTFLALTAIVMTTKRQSGTYVLTSVAGLYLAFGVVSLVPMHLAELTHVVGHLDTLELPRGGVKIEGAAFFQDLIHLLQEHSPNGLLYAGNDCPELYFLAGLNNVTRTDGGASAADVLRALESDDLKVVVINEAPFFPTAQMNPEVRAEVMRKFPESRLVGIFRVFWRP
jgi:hypothetical protein